MGRPTKCVPEVTERLLNALRAGAYAEIAAAHAGISRRTFEGWLRDGARDLQKGIESDKATLSAAVDKAMGDSELRDLATIARFADGFEVEKHYTLTVLDADGKVLKRETKTEKRIERSWQAAAWRLERRYPQRWGKKFGMTDGEGNPMGGRVVIELPDNGRRNGGNGDRATDRDSARGQERPR